MTGEFSWLWAVLLTVSIAAVLTLFTIWSRKETRVRAAAIAVFLVAVGASPLVAPLALSWPKQIAEGFTPGEYRVLGTKLLIGKGIYVLIDNGQNVPQYLKFPWDKDMADKIQDMLDNPENEGIKLTVPFEWSWDNNPPQFHPAPRPKVLPDKFAPEHRVPTFDT
jgi:hypothetical protein